MARHPRCREIPSPSSAENKSVHSEVRNEPRIGCAYQKRQRPVIAGGKKETQPRRGKLGECSGPGLQELVRTRRRTDSPLRSGPRRARNFQSSGNSTRPCRLKDLESPAFRLTRFRVDCHQTCSTRPEKSRPLHRVFFPCCRRRSGPLCSMKVTQSLARNHLGPLWIAGIGVRSSLASGTTVKGAFFDHFQGSSPFSHEIILDPQDV